MKYLLVLIVVGVAFWLWRSGRKTDRETIRPPKPASERLQPQVMLRCAHCGIHLPEAESTPGRQGVYCSVAHRQVAEG